MTAPLADAYTEKRETEAEKREVTSMKTRLLSDIPVGDTVTVLSVSDDTGLRRRLYDIGLRRGAVVTALGRSSGGSLYAYSIDGASFALRSRDASTVSVEASP